LQQEFDPFIEALKADGETNLEFQQDNARPHIARRTTEFLEALASKHGLTIIQNIWSYLKHELRQRYPDTATLKGSPDTIRATLQERIHKLWWYIGSDILRTYMESMPCRVQQVLQARGWYTEY